MTIDARPLGDPADEDVAAEILRDGGPAELVGQPGEEPPVDGGVLCPGSVAAALAGRRAALDALLLEGLGVVLDGSAADPEPLGEGGVGEPGFVPPGLGNGLPAFGRVGWAVQSGPTSTSDTLRLLATDRADIGIVSLLDFLTSYQQNQPITAFMALVQRPLGSLLTLEKSGITSPKDLEGKTVGVTGVPNRSHRSDRPGRAGHRAAARWCGRHSWVPPCCWRSGTAPGGPGTPLPVAH